MRKIILATAAIILSLSILPWGHMSGASSSSPYKVIPDEAIRLRILADNNEEKAQELKRDVRDAVNAEITTWVEDLTSIDAARALIQSRLQEIDAIVKETIEQSEMTESYQVEYGKQVEFPTKLYGSYIYPAGEYEAILITLGEGEGDNWWCVLFPPLCFLDFSNGATVAHAEEKGAEQEQEKEAAEPEKQEVEFFLVKLWNKIVS
ncbi:stage II sporulation protein R [Halobacillus naozhouensis]|uniref:Stage II sporulation protein R n=1 Tax=Halobacillus naozhouensis TaxID=554880 RepID=A0ABY8IX19_9BACI|nr:stage II sporulation protein R [Halobacillus naozhouensis]WFT74377.1 stage II sporulation protein R [Halobacillus naozhouensis]